MLIVLMVVVVALLGWVGWAYFLQSSMSAGVMVPAPVSVDSEQRSRSASGKNFWGAWLALLSGWGKGFRRLLSGVTRSSVLLILAPVGLVVLTALVVLSQRDRVVVAPARVQANLYEAAVGNVLREQKLAPPAPLPPAVFANTESRSFTGADRDWSKLDPVFSQLVLRVMDRLRQRGVEVVLLEGYRSPERQEALANQANKVTDARAFQSKHQFGLAVDLAPYRDGHLIISEADPWAAKVYELLGQEAEAVGLTWGGHWSFRDLGHIEAPGSISKNLRAAAMAKAK